MSNIAVKDAPHPTKTGNSSAQKIPANIGIPVSALQGLADMLNTILADEVVLYTKVRKSHWNVTGIHFHDLHLLFEGMYEELGKISDDVAERVRILGHHAIGTMKDFLAETHLLETSDTSDAHAMVSDLLNDYEIVIRILRESAAKADKEFKDSGTNDFLIGIMEKHEKKAWMLRSILS